MSISDEMRRREEELLKMNEELDRETREAMAAAESALTGRSRADSPVDVRAADRIGGPPSPSPAPSQLPKPRIRVGERKTSSRGGSRGLDSDASRGESRGATRRGGRQSTPRSNTSSGSTKSTGAEIQQQVKSQLQHVQDMDRMTRGLSGEALERFLKKQIDVMKSISTLIVIVLAPFSTATPCTLSVYLSIIFPCKPESQTYPCSPSVLHCMFFCWLS